MDVVAELPADPQRAEPVQVGEGALHNPALLPRPDAVLGAAAGDQRLMPRSPDQAAVLVVVVAAVGEQHVRAAARPADACRGLAARPSSSGMSWVTSLRLPPVKVTASGMPRGIGEQVVLAARPARSTGLRPVLGPLLTPGYESRRPPLGRSPGRSHRVSSASRTSCSRVPYAGLRSSSARRRQQVMPEPKPSSCGRCSQRDPGVQHEQDALEHQPVRSRLRPGCRDRRSTLAAAAARSPPTTLVDLPPAPPPRPPLNTPPHDDVTRGPGRLAPAPRPTPAERAGTPRSTHLHSHSSRGLPLLRQKGPRQTRTRRVGDMTYGGFAGRHSSRCRKCAQHGSWEPRAPSDPVAGHSCAW